MSDRFMKRLGRGATSTIHGLFHVRKDREVRKAYRFILLALFLVTVLLEAGGAYAVWHFTEPSDDVSTWLAWGLFLLRIVGIASVLLVAPIVAITACNLLFPVFSEIPFLAGMRSFDEARGRRLAARAGLGNAAAVGNSLRRFGAFLAITLGCFVLGWVPIVGPVMAPPLQFYFAVKTVSWEMMDPYFDRVGIRWPDQKKITKCYAPEFLGMGLVCVPLLAIPVIGPLLFGLVQAGTAKFVVDVFPEGDEASNLIPSKS